MRLSTLCNREDIDVNRNFWKAGHLPTLFSAFLYFDISFMVWYVLGPLAVQIAQDLQLSAQDRGLMVATPILAGAVFRLAMGVLVDHLSPKRAGILGQTVVMLALAAAWHFGISSFAAALILGVFLGFAGAAFAVALPLASRWYPPEHQGTAMGIAGAGNSGTVFAALFAPALAALFGWRNVFGLALLPLGLVFIVFLYFAKDGPRPPAPKSLAQYLGVLRHGDAWRFMFFYGVTFGGFVGLAGALPGYFHDQYGLSPVTAGYFTAACVFGGSLMRPLGGAIADRVGGIRSLLVMYSLASLNISIVACNLSSVWATLFFFVVAMLALGAGNGAVFQLVPQRYRNELGVMTGLIGMAGGVGGFVLAAGLGYFKQTAGDYSVGLWLFAGLAGMALLGLYRIKHHWRITWGALVPARV